MIKHKLQVHTAFNLVYIKEGENDPSFKPFTPGVVVVTEQEAAHPWVQQHTEYLEEVEVEDEAVAEEEETPRSKKRK